MADNTQSRGFYDFKVKEGDPDMMYIGSDSAEEGVDFSAVTLSVNVNVSEALTGLKALQREAKEATKALRELENVKVEDDSHEYRVKEHAWQSGTGVVIDDTVGKPIKFFDIKIFSTDSLKEELERRERANARITVNHVDASNINDVATFMKKLSEVKPSH